MVILSFYLVAVAALVAVHDEFVGAVVAVVDAVAEAAAVHAHARHGAPELQTLRK